MHIIYGNDLVQGGGGERERRVKGMGRDWGRRREKRGKEMGGGGKARGSGKGCVHDVEWWMW